MNAEECYQKIEGSYEEVLKRLRSEERIIKYLYKFLEDGNYETLKKAMEEKDYAVGFMAVHNVKGLSQNLSFTRLEQAASDLCEALRGEKHPPEEEIRVLWEQVEKAYGLTAEAVQELKKERENG